MIALPVTCPLFIGREDELAALRDARRALSRSRGSFVLVAGETGIGKSRLLAHFASRTGDRRVRYFATAECVEKFVEPLGPVRSLLATLLAVDVPADLPANARRAIARLTPAFAAAAGEHEAPGPIDRADLFAGLAATLVAFATRKSTILFIEDLHWADPTTLDFLAYLAPRIAERRLLIVVTHRSEASERSVELQSALARIEREPTALRIVLAPLREANVRALLKAALDGRATIEDAVFERIVRRCEGNPFFAEELLKDATTRGREDDGRLPVSIRGSVAERVARFDANDRRMLSYAAVLGLRFDPTILAELLERSVDDVLPAFERAREAGILIDDRTEPALLRFRHALLRQVIYDDLLAFDARRLHERILRVLERREAEPAGSLLFALAEHAAAARDVERTIAYAERAAESAWSMGSYAESIVYFETSLAATVDDGKRAWLLERMAYPIGYGDSHRMLELWTEALAIRLRRREYSDAARIYQSLLCERYNSGIVDDGSAALDLVASHGDEIARVTRDAVRVTVATVRSECCNVETVDSVLGGIEDVANLYPAALQNVHRTRMNQAAYFGRIDDWRSEFERLRSIGPRHEKPSVDALNVADSLASALQSGIYLDAHAELEKAIAIGRERLQAFGFTRYYRYFDALEATYLTSRGRLTAARAALERSLGADDYLTAAVGRRVAPFLALALGDDALVERIVDTEFIESERAAVRAQPSSHHSRIFLGGYALRLDRRGFSAEASELLGVALDDLPFPSPRFAPLVTFALRHLGAERVPGLETFARTDRLSPGDAVGRATATLAGAALAKRDGRDDAARDGYRAAAGAYERLGFWLCAAHAYHLGDAHAEANAIYVRCDAAGYVRGAGDVRTPDTVPAVDALSERERRVSELVTLGLTNLEVAERMSISAKTVEKYLSSIFRKLGVRSRTQIAAHVASQLASPR